MRRSRAWPWIAALVACLVLPAGAAAADPAAIRAVADQASRAWAKRQAARGAFVDPASGTRAGGYGGAMIGYGLLRDGVRRHDPRAIAAGVRAITRLVRAPPGRRGVFAVLTVAAAYNFVRSADLAEPAVRRAAPRWRRYLQAAGAPRVENPDIRSCVASPGCFHNHEMVETLGHVELLRSRLRSPFPDALLASPAALRAAVLAKVGREVPGYVGTSAVSSGRPPRTGLGLLADTGAWPLAYHALSTMMLGEAVRRLGPAAPRGARAALRRAAEALAAAIAPDGDVAYLGRRQQVAWALAAAVGAGQSAAAAFRRDPDAVGRFVAVADRALRRLRAVHAGGPAGLRPVPRPLRRANGLRGVDQRPVVVTGLTIFLLNLAADAADQRPALSADALPSDRNGWFLDPAQARFAAVRDGDLWYAAHARSSDDERSGFGLLALKRRDPRGRWVDLLRPRPMTSAQGGDTGLATPTIVAAGERLLPYGEGVAVEAGGVVAVRGGFRSLAGVPVRPGVTFRFVPVPGGVSLRFPVRRGDLVRVTAFLPASAAGRGARSVVDRRARYSVPVRPAAVRYRRGLASCCDAHLVAATMEVEADRDRLMSYAVRARDAVPAGIRLAGRFPPLRPLVPPESGTPALTWLPLSGAVLVLLALLHRARRPARGDRRRPSAATAGGSATGPRGGGRW